MSREGACLSLHEVLEFMLCFVNRKCHKRILRLRFCPEGAARLLGGEDSWCRTLLSSEHGCPAVETVWRGLGTLGKHHHRHTRPRGLEGHDFMSLTAPRMPDIQTLIISLNLPSSCFRPTLRSLPGSGGNAVRLLILRTFYLGNSSAFLLQCSGSFFIPYKAPSPLHSESVCALEEAAVGDGSTAFGGQEVRSGVELAWGCRAIADQGHYLRE